MNRPKLLPYLGIRILVFTPLLLFALLSVLRLPQWGSISIYIIVSLALILFIITQKSEAYMPGLMVTMITGFSIGFFGIAYFQEAYRTDLGLHVYANIQFFLCISANVLYEIGIWRHFKHSPESKVSFNKYLLASAILFCFCLGPMIFVLDPVYMSAPKIFALIPLLVAVLFAGNPIPLLLIGYYLFRKKANIAHKAYVIYSLIYAVVLVFSPFLFASILTLLGFTVV